MNIESLPESIPIASDKLPRYFFNLPFLGMAVISPKNMRFLEVNDRLCEILGYSREELATMSVIEVSHPDDAPPSIAALEDLLRGESEGYVVDKRFVRKDGAIVYVTVDVKRIGPSGAVEYILSTVQDITERKKTIEKLQESERKYRELVEDANSIILRLARDGSILFINEFGQQFFGYTEAELLGQRAINFIVPEIESGGRDLKLLMDGICADPKKFERNINENIRRSGERVWVSWTNRIILDEHGEVKEILCVGSDITEQKRLDNILREREHQISIIYDTVEDPIFNLKVEGDGSYRFASVNRCFLSTTGLQAGQVIGKPVREVIPKSSLPITLEKSAEAIRDRKVVRWVDTSDYPAGRLTGEISIAPVFDNSMKCVGLTGSVHDITERKRSEEEIQQHIVKLNSALMHTVGVATTLSEIRDPYTAGHERRVAEIAVAIGEALGLDQMRLEGLRVAGGLHDIGKIAVPTEILAKPGKLNHAEFALIKFHPSVGYDALKDVDFPWPVAQVALQHHERMDGNGYPQGLKGEEILFEARILAVADVVESMASHRPYRPALGIERALAEIERGRGMLYDPQVSDACLRLFREMGYQIFG